MLKHLHPRPDRDRGAILLLALVLVVVLGLVVVGIATYTSAALKTSQVTDEIVDTLALAESGMQYGLARADGGNCPASTNDVIAGTTVTTTCQKVARVENADGLYALVVTALGVNSASHDALILTGAASESGRKKISGPVYLGEQMKASLTSAVAVALDGATEVPGDVKFDVAGDCTTSSVSPAPAAAWEAPQPVVSCDSRGWEAAASRPNLSVDPLAPATDLQKATLFSGPSYGEVGNPVPTPNLSGCLEFTPGWFKGSLLAGNRLNLNGPTFFKSGVYYFEDVEIDISDQLAIGKRLDLATPSSPTSGIDYPSSCSTEWTNETNATGAVWILGGSSRIVGTKANVDFYPRQVERTNTTLGPANMAVIAFEPGAPTTYGYAATSLSANEANNQDGQKILWRANGSQTDISFYGLVYVPGSFIDMNNASADARVQFIGGIVGARIDIRIAANVPGFTISVPTQLIDYHLLETTATSSGVTTVVRTVSKEGASGLEVITWRVV